MNRLFGAGLLAGLLVASFGCGGDKIDAGLIPVAGNIVVDGQPSPHTLVTFHPQGDTGGHGGNGATDSTGHYTISSPYGKKGLPPGKYNVTLSRRLNPDGSPPPPDEKPIESNARETLPVIYTDAAKTKLTATLDANDKKSFDFELKVKKK